MKESVTQHPVGKLRDELGLTVEEFAEKLGLSSPGHVSDLCNGNRNVTQRIAVRLEKLSGRAWHLWMTKARAA